MLRELEDFRMLPCDILNGTSSVASGKTALHRRRRFKAGVRNMMERAVVKGLSETLNYPGINIALNTLKAQRRRIKLGAITKLIKVYVSPSGRVSSAGVVGQMYMAAEAVINTRAVIPSRFRHILWYLSHTPTHTRSPIYIHIYVRLRRGLLTGRSPKC